MSQERASPDDPNAKNRRTRTEKVSGSRFIIDIAVTGTGLPYKAVVDIAQEALRHAFAARTTEIAMEVHRGETQMEDLKKAQALVIDTGDWSAKSIRALRAARRMTVRQFGEHLGVSDRMVSHWEAGIKT